MSAAPGQDEQGETQEDHEDCAADLCGADGDTDGVCILLLVSENLR